MENQKPKITFIELHPPAPDDPSLTHNYERDVPHAEPVKGQVTIKIASQAEQLLGPTGRLISASKSSYSDQHPDHEVLFNACVFDAQAVEIWFGDLDLTLDAPRLQQLADLFGEIYVTPESPFRLDGLRGERSVHDRERIVRFAPRRT
jgi:hypothetical protein